MKRIWEYWAMKDHSWGDRIIFYSLVIGLICGAWELGWMFWWYLGMRILALLILGFLLLPFWWELLEKWVRK